MRRWAWTIFFLMAFLLSAGVWGGSYWRYGSLKYSRGYSLTIDLEYGSVELHGGHWVVTGFLFDNDRADDLTRMFNSLRYDRSRYHFAGFALEPSFRSWPGDVEWMAFIPLWLPTALSALGLLWAWRRKRRKDMAAKQGFPVEAVKRTGEVAGGQ